MKTLLFGLTLLASMSSFANTMPTCYLIEGMSLTELELNTYNNSASARVEPIEVRLGLANGLQDVRVRIYKYEDGATKYDASMDFNANLESAPIELNFASDSYRVQCSL